MVWTGKIKGACKLLHLQHLPHQPVISLKVPITELTPSPEGQVYEYDCRKGVRATWASYLVLTNNFSLQKLIYNISRKATRGSYGGSARGRESISINGRPGWLGKLRNTGQPKKVHSSLGILNSTHLSGSEGLLAEREHQRQKCVGHILPKKTQIREL